MAETGNGAALLKTGAASLVTTLVGFIALWSWLSAPTVTGLTTLEKKFDDFAKSQATEIKGLRKDLVEQIDKLNEGRVSNAASIASLNYAVIEAETQHRCSAVVRNVEHQMTDIVVDLLQQCPTCRAKARSYWPPGPGPNGGTPH